MASGDRKTQIVQEATRLFSHAGFDKVTIKQLAEACGITEPALYRHFVSKDAIYDAVLDAIEQRLQTQELFERLKDEVEVERLLGQFARFIVSFFSENEDLYRLLLFSALREHAKSRHVFQVVRGNYVKFLTKQLDRLYEQGIIIKKNNEITARCFTGMVFDCAMGSTLWRGLQGRHFAPEDVIDNNIPIYVRGLRAVKE